MLSLIIYYLNIIFIVLLYLYVMRTRDVVTFRRASVTGLNCRLLTSLMGRSTYYYVISFVACTVSRRELANAMNSGAGR